MAPPGRPGNRVETRVFWSWLMVEAGARATALLEPDLDGAFGGSRRERADPLDEGGPLDLRLVAAARVVPPAAPPNEVGPPRDLLDGVGARTRESTPTPDAGRDCHPPGLRWGLVPLVADRQQHGEVGDHAVLAEGVAAPGADHHDVDALVGALRRSLQAPPR